MAGRSRKPLAGRVAVVAGATRGAGRGAARGLGEAGAVVYCTGRSVRGNPSPYGRPETIEETAELVREAGGTAHPVRVDHCDEVQVGELFERIAAEHGRVDVLVNSIAGEDPRLSEWTSFWELDLSNAVAILENAVLSHVITAKHAAKMMIAKRRGLIVEVVENDLLFASGNILMQLVKASLKALALSMAEELLKNRVAAISITPGFLRSEVVLDHFGVTEATWREGGKKDPHFLQSESPLYVGRAITALAADPKVLAWTGRLTSTWEVARNYGLTDIDGRRPDWGTHARDVVVPSMKWYREGLERHAAWLEVLSERARSYLAGVAVPA
jgi:NAD(P)-dependent dehydrogenase (short-subunit alcohol dehydrogenase family)